MKADFCTTCKTYTENWRSTFDDACLSCEPNPKGEAVSMTPKGEIDPMTAYKEQSEDIHDVLPWGHPDRNLYWN